MEPAFVLGQAYPNNIREAIEDQEVQGTGYELEFEDEYDSGTVARSETLFFARWRFCWNQSINRLVKF
jgi:hypothetical protein